MNDIPCCCKCNRREETRESRSNHNSPRIKQIHPHPTYLGSNSRLFAFNAHKTVFPCSDSGYRIKHYTHPTQLYKNYQISQKCFSHLHIHAHSLSSTNSAAPSSPQPSWHRKCNADYYRRSSFKSYTIPILYWLPSCRIGKKRLWVPCSLAG